MEIRFNFKEAEQRWLEIWRKAGLGEPSDGAGEPFVMVIPPPNITGSLHMGHALDNILPDCLIRFYLTQNRSSLRVPGTDHAGIATQYVVEKNLKTQGIDRNSLTRQEFETVLRDWAEKTKTNILEQMVNMGCLMDFSRTRFTMDEMCSRAVRHAFKALFDRGLIYQGDRLISWCTRCRSALSDLELEHQTQKGKLYCIRYPLRDGSGFITVATTRPETMLGDSAVAVNPGDERYKGKEGQVLTLPLMNRDIKIVADYRVESGFGTGAVKVTPGHDPLDWAIGQDHGLSIYRVVGEDGTITAAGGQYAGLKVEQARKKVVEDLKAQGFLDKEEPYQHNVAVCYRCAQVVEPLISKQWFLNMEPLKKLAIEAYEKRGEPKFFPEHWGGIYFEWLKGLRDWCLSRQIIWGHRIPVWHCAKGCPAAAAVETPDRCPTCGGTDLVQDPDVLDTWFSSGLWPMSVFGWPEATPDFKRFYPTTLMVTGYDITYLWVARMIMMGLYFSERVPFRQVYLHGLIRDAQGRKMSKTLGNVINPQDIQNEYGTDALRYALLAGAQPGRDIYMAKDAFVGAKNFVTKIWNAGRFIKVEWEKPGSELASGPPHPSDDWMVSEAATVASEAARELQALDPAAALRRIYDSFWGHFCDWYLEIVKIRRSLNSNRGPLKLLTEIYGHYLKMIGPFMPFVSHEIAHELKNLHGWDLLARESWPSSAPLDEHRREASRHWWHFFSGVVTEIRVLRSDLNIAPGEELAFHLEGSKNGVFSETDYLLVESMTRAKRAPEALPGTRIRRPVLEGHIELVVYMSRDWDGRKEAGKLTASAKELDQAIERLEALLEKSDFASKAPPDVVQKERERLSGLKNRRGKIADYLQQLGA
ncbi:MAG: valine--tRNA ligase [Elusimicrobia bacterium]|nr:valine--tRNA ligase [Elusimicrobiota bacterium]